VREQGGKSPSRDYDISRSPSFDEGCVSVPLEEFSEAVNGSGIGGSEWKRGKRRRRERKERGGVREEVW